ncbi:HEPN domain-containing protein [Cupriavidus plantarum]|uniref:HEPN domain-containing protein n=1 Tax=Cupriavidus plantarum TaxID=942865 RepID=UPI00339D3AD7
MDATFARAPSPNTDPEFQADFAKYLCVLVSGYLESALCALLLGFAQARSAGDVSSFVERQLGPWTNPKAEKIIDLFGSFNQDWRVNLTAYLVDQRKDSLNSLVALRHKIAHGESVGTSLSQIKSHYRIANEVIDHVADLLDPQGGAGVQRP